MNKPKAYTLQEIADKYNITIRTLNNWLSPIRKELLELNPSSKKRLRILLPKQVKRIEDFLG